jgi:ABC-type lipoprotein release transport system permease subunit
LQSPFGSGTHDLHPTVSWPLTLMILAGSVLFCILASLAPATKAASVEPVKAFRGQI